MSLKVGLDVVDAELEGIVALRQALESSDTFERVLDEISQCTGRVIISGMGKAGHIARKISATMASTGTPSFFLHPGEALHGDLGMITSDDIMLLFSNSGESEEITRIIPNIKAIGSRIIGVTSNVRSTLASQCDVLLYMGTFSEACPLRLAPTSSTTVMLVLGDVLSICLMRRKNFTVDEYGLFHPGGALGMKALPVRNYTRPKEKCAIVAPDTLIGDTLIQITQTHTGSAVILSNDSMIEGIFTDGDLRRGLKEVANITQHQVSEFMTRDCVSVNENKRTQEAVEIMLEKKISEIPVVDSSGRFTGLVELKQLPFLNK